MNYRMNEKASEGRRMDCSRDIKREGKKEERRTWRKMEQQMTPEQLVITKIKEH
jgi:hypothetical protein